MLVSPDSIAPSQNFLKPETIRFIFQCIADGEFDKLPPRPIVRSDSDGRLVAIDGHSLIAVQSFLGQQIDVHLAHSPQDGIAGDTEADRTRNRMLKEKYDSVLAERQRVADSGIGTFADLIALYGTLFDARMKG